MPPIALKIDDLVLDTDNPRITHAEGQQQALQKVVRDQKTKLVKLAESIVEHGLSPIDRFLVMEVSQKPKRYVALEGNRRVAALRLLINPAAMTGLEMPQGMQRSFERLAKVFDRSTVEPLDAFEIGAREEGKYWIELRHNGESEGRGIVSWKPITAARFRNRSAEIQAFDMVMEHGGFTDDEAENIRDGFKLSTLKRFTDDSSARAALGLTVEKGQLCTVLPGSELIKPLRRIVLDIAEKKIDSRQLNKTDRILKYLQDMNDADKPDHATAGASRPIEAIQKDEFAKAKRRGGGGKKSPGGKKPEKKERPNVVPKNCPVNVTSNRISEIYEELRTLKLDGARNAIAVLLRVFLEMSVDHFLEANGGSLKFTPGNGQREGWKTLDKKLAETVEMLVKIGVPKAHFAAITRDLKVKTSPMNIDLFHQYVHDRFATPSPGDLTAAWDHAQPLFEKIWP